MGELDERAARWVRQAIVDREAAGRLRDLDLHYAACFFAQQAGEKALKGTLFHLRIDPGRTHSVRELARALEAIRSDHSGVADEVAILDQYYVPTRYPDALPSGIPADAYVASDSERALRAADTVLSLARAHLGL